MLRAVADHGRDGVRGQAKLGQQRARDRFWRHRTFHQLWVRLPNPNWNGRTVWFRLGSRIGRHCGTGNTFSLRRPPHGMLASPSGSTASAQILPSLRRAS